MERNRYFERVETYIENMKSKETLINPISKSISTEVLKEHLTVLKEFDENSILENFTLETRKCYLIGMRQFFNSVKKPVDQITREDIKSYLFNLKVMPKTLQVRKTIIKYFFKWFYKAESNYPEVVSWINTSLSKKDCKRLPKDQLLTQEEVLKIANATTTLRDKAFVLTLYESACRINELISLRIKNVVFDAYGAMLKVNGKTGERVIRLLNTESSWLVLRDWLNQHPFKNNIEVPVFANMANGCKGDFVGKEYAGHKIKIWCRIAGINKNVYPHLFRHSRLTELARKGYNESFLRKFAGWEGDSRMADIYVSLSARDIDNVMLEKEGIINKNDNGNGKVLSPIKCSKCGEPNSPTNRFCATCSMPLDQESMEEIAYEKKWMEFIKNHKTELREMMNKETI